MRDKVTIWRALEILSVEEDAYACFMSVGCSVRPGGNSAKVIFSTLFEKEANARVSW